jgi:hypothetical protein
MALRRGRELNKKLRVSHRSDPSWPRRRDVMSSMPRYFFNMRIGKELILDPEGEELRDADHAWHVAWTTIREILKTGGDQALSLAAIMQVTDEEGQIVLEFPFVEAIIDPSEKSGTKH